MSYLKSEYNIDGISLVKINDVDYIVGNFTSEQRYCVDNGMVITINETADRDPMFVKYKRPRRNVKTPAQLLEMKQKQDAFKHAWELRHPGKKFQQKIRPIGETRHFLPKVKKYDVKSFGPDGKIKKHMFGVYKPVQPVTKKWQAKTKKALSAKDSQFDPLPPHPYQAWFVSRKYPTTKKQQLTCSAKFVYSRDTSVYPSVIYCYARWGYYTNQNVPAIGDPITRILGISATGKTVNDYLSIRVADELKYDVFLDTDSERKAKLLEKMWNKASGSSFNLLVALGEAGQTWTMLINTVTTLLHVIIAFKKFDFVEVFRLLTVGRNRNLRPDLSATDIAKLSTYSLTDAWLAFRFGWQPLFQDIISLQEKLNFISTQADVRKFRVRTSSNSQTHNNVPHRYISGVTIDTVTRVTDYQLVAYLKGGMDFVTMFQLDSKASLAWELLPFSFVIDWFVQIGDRIAAYEHAQNLHGTFVYTKTTYTTLSGMSIKQAAQGNPQVIVTPGTPPSFTLTGMNAHFKPPKEAIPANVTTYGPYCRARAAYVAVPNGTALQPIESFTEYGGSPLPTFTGGTCPVANGSYLNVFDTSDSRFFESVRDVDRIVLNDLTDFGQDLQFENKFVSSFDLHSIDALSLLIQQVKS